MRFPLFVPFPPGTWDEWLGRRYQQASIDEWRIIQAARGVTPRWWMWTVMLAMAVQP